MPDVQVVVAGPGGDAEEGEREDEEDGVEGGEHLEEVAERGQHVQLLPRQHLEKRVKLANVERQFNVVWKSLP